MPKSLQQYPMDAPNYTDDYIKIIKELIQKEIQNLPYNKSVVAVVASTPTGIGGTCSIKLLNEGNTITLVKIRSGLSLTFGDEVYVTFINNASSNFFIDFKK